MSPRGGNAFIFGIVATGHVKPFEEAARSARSMSLLNIGFEHDSFVIRDPAVTPDSVANDIAGMLGASVIDAGGGRIPAKDYGCVYMSMLDVAIRRIFGDKPESGVVLSIPAVWQLTSKVNMSMAHRVVKYDPNVFSVFFGGYPTAHLDSGRAFFLEQTGISGYQKMKGLSWDYAGLDRIMCPSIFRVDLFEVLASADEQSMNKLSNCGWNDKFKVLYPDALTREPGDGKPEPFKDIVGICPEYWDKYELKEDGDGQV